MEGRYKRDRLPFIAVKGLLESALLRKTQMIFFALFFV